MTGLGPQLAGGTGLEGALSGAGSGVFIDSGIPVPVLNNVTSITNTGLDGSVAMAIDPSGNYLIVTSPQGAKLSCVDITDRANPTVANTIGQDITNLGTNYSICINQAGTIAYVGGGANNVTAIDITNLPALTIIAKTTNTAWSVSYNLKMLGPSHIALPALNDSRINIVNRTNPAAMTVADFTDSIAARNVEVKDDRWVYVTTPTGVDVFDCADPTNMLHTQTAAALAFGPTFAPALYDNAYLVVTTHGTNISGLRVMDLADPSVATEVSGSAINHAVTSNQGGQVIAGDYSFAIWGGTDLRAHDLSPIHSNNPITLVDDLTLPYATTRGIVWHPDNYLYITGANDDRLMVVSTS